LVGVDQQQQFADFLRTSCGLTEINFVEASSVCADVTLNTRATSMHANWAPIDYVRLGEQVFAGDVRAVRGR
jgi:hypothetical protein